MRTTAATAMKPLNTITAVPLTAVTNQPIVAKTTQQPAVAAAAAVAAGNVFDNMDRQLDFYNHVLLPAAVDDPNSSPQKKQIKNAADLSNNLTPLGRGHHPPCREGLGGSSNRFLIILYRCTNYFPEDL